VNDDMEHLDRDALSALQDIMEDEYPLLLDTFLEDSSKRLGQLHQASNAADLAAAAHSFKGSSSNMGALRLAELCRQLEQLAGQSPLAGVEGLINQIDREYEVVRRFYESERERFPVRP